MFLFIGTCLHCVTDSVFADVKQLHTVCHERGIRTVARNGECRSLKWSLNYHIWKIIIIIQYILIFDPGEAIVVNKPTPPQNNGTTWPSIWIATSTWGDGVPTICAVVHEMFESNLDNIRNFTARNLFIFSINSELGFCETANPFFVRKLWGPLGYLRFAWHQVKTSGVKVRPRDLISLNLGGGSNNWTLDIAGRRAHYSTPGHRRHLVHD